MQPKKTCDESEVIQKSRVSVDSIGIGIHEDMPDLNPGRIQPPDIKGTYANTKSHDSL